MRAPGSALVEFIKRWRMRFAVGTVLLYFAAVLLLVFALPEVTNNQIALLLMGSGFLGALATLADMLVSSAFASSPGEAEMQKMSDEVKRLREERDLLVARLLHDGEDSTDE